MSTYEAQDDSVNTDAYGGSLGYEYRWSEVGGVAVDLFYEQDDATRTLPVPSKESTSGWGGTVSAYRQGEVSTGAFRLAAVTSRPATAARYSPISSGCNMTVTSRNACGSRGAARYESRTGFTAQTEAQDRDYARADLSFRWMMSPTWYLEGGYSYIWQDRASASGDADNNRLFVSVGYQGLDRQRR